MSTGAVRFVSLEQGLGNAAVGIWKFQANQVLRAFLLQNHFLTLTDEIYVILLASLSGMGANLGLLCPLAGGAYIVASLIG